MSEAPHPAAVAQDQAERATAALFAGDRASQALGMRITGVRPGWARVVMSVRPDMVNGHGLCHGGLVFALGDSAFAFACNSDNDSMWPPRPRSISWLPPAKATS
jgi:acyl-coenzyme A thioesterase PaaI-like protein